MVVAAVSAALDVGQPLPSHTTRRARERDRLLLVLWFLGGLYASVAIVGWRTALGYDAHAYWLAWHHSPMYGLPPNTADAYLYSPAFAQVLWPLAQLPWPLFLAAWTVAGFALYAWLLRPLGRALAAPLLLFCLPQAMVGNIWPLLAVVLVFGFRRPGLWAFPLLTKVTAGVGVVWFAARGEWRNLARVLVPTIARDCGVRRDLAAALGRLAAHPPRRRDGRQHSRRLRHPARLPAARCTRARRLRRAALAARIPRPRDGARVPGLRAQLRDEQRVSPGGAPAPT